MIKIKYQYRLFTQEAVSAAVISYGLFLIARPILHQLNYEKLLESLVTLNSGIVIAIFIAIFHSSNGNVINFKKFKEAAKQMYIIFLVNSIIVCAISLLITNISNDVNVLSNQAVYNVSGIALASVISFVNVRLVYKLIAISFRA